MYTYISLSCKHEQLLFAMQYEVRDSAEIEFVRSIVKGAIC